ncbi:MAG: thioredoxin [Myxococcales bacterium]|nr:thioredoxin [Myxococcales bacterium]
MMLNSRKALVSLGAVKTFPVMHPSSDQALTSPGLTLIDFTAAWCGPCKQLRPVLESLASEKQIKLAMIDVDHDPVLAQQFQVRSMPTVVLWRDGREVGRFVGARHRAYVAGMIDRALAGDTAIAAP